MSRKEGTPKYYYIQRELETQIEEGEYSKGDFLPTEEQLQEIYDVSRITIRRALENLKNKGYINRNQGVGSQVIFESKEYKSPYLKSFTEEMSEKHKETSSKVISFNIVQAGNNLGKKLGIDENSEVYYFERVRYADGVPMIFARTFMAVEKHPNLVVSDLEYSKLEYAKSNNIKVVYSTQQVKATLADEYIASYLKIERNTPLIKVKNTLYMKDDSVFDFTEVYLNPTSYELTIRKDSIME